MERDWALNLSLPQSQANPSVRSFSENGALRFLSIAMNELVDNERINKVISLDPCLKHRFVGCFANDTIPVSGYKGGRFAIVNTSPHYYSNGHWLLVACQQKKLILYDSFGLDSTSFFPEMSTALKKGLRVDYNTNIYQLNPSDLSKQSLQSSLCAFYSKVTAHFLYNHSLDSFLHYLIENILQVVLSNYDLKNSPIKLLKRKTSLRVIHLGNQLD